MGALGQISFFVALILVILVHEAAHFFVAKGFGIKVTEFFVGFGPRLWSTRRGETEYGVKAVPAGGYVKIAGMNPYEHLTAEDAPRVFGAKPIWQRALVIFAGPATHFVLAFLCFAAWMGFVGVPVPGTPILSSVVPALGDLPSPAAEAGLRPGDRIVRIDALRHVTADAFVGYTRDHVGEPITLTVVRDGQSLTFTVTPVLATVEGERVGRIGVRLTSEYSRQTRGVVASVAGGGRLVRDSVTEIVGKLGDVFGPSGFARIGELLFTDAPRQPDDPASVLGAARIAGQTAEDGRFWDILYLVALVNLFIGLLNLVPLPPFDGGHLAVLALEKLRGRRVDMRKVVPVSAAVAVFLVLFTLSVIYIDIVKPPNLTP